MYSPVSLLTALAVNSSDFSWQQCMNEAGLKWTSTCLSLVRRDANAGSKDACSTHTYLCIGRQELQSCDVQAEFNGLCELPKTRSHRHELVAGNVRRQFQNFLTAERQRGEINSWMIWEALATLRYHNTLYPGLPHVVHAVVVQPETVRTVRSVHE